MTESLSTTDQHVSYDEYRRALSFVSSISPQMQGLSLQEFSLDVGRTPGVYCSTVEGEMGEVQIPQLSPVELYPWLNSDYYKNAFPREYANDNLSHYVEYDGVTPSKEVADRIQSLADTEGVLVFDYPDADSEYMSRLQSMLDSLDVETTEEIALGSQTYYAGKCRLKQVNTTGQDSDIQTTFRRMIDDGILKSEVASGASYHETLTEEQAESLYDSYAEAFQVLNDHPCRQGIDADEFKELITRDREVIKLINQHQSNVVTVCLLGDDLTKFDWLNTKFYEDRFPEETRANELIYFPAIYTDPTARGVQGAGAVVRLLTQMSEYGKHEVVVAFDCCDMNKDVLASYLARLINKSSELSVEFEVIGAQLYKAVRLQKASRS